MARRPKSTLEEEIEALATEDDESVLDEAATEEIHSDTFTISSYGADYTVDGLVKRMTSGAFFVPDFQRGFVWNQRQASRFVESLLMGLPVPGLFVFKEQNSSKHLIIDGQQRLTTLAAFYKDDFRNRKFRLLDVAPRWQEKTYAMLEENDRQRLDDAVIHTTVFKQDQPDQGKRSIYEVFERINTGGLKLSAQEIRSSVNHGAFTTLLRELNEAETWRALYGPRSDRIKDQELILRFLALYYARQNYKRPMRRFLDEFLEKNSELSNGQAETFRKLFAKTISTAFEALGENAFRPEKQMNAAVFDSVMVGLAERLTKRAKPDNVALQKEYSKLLLNEEFRASYTKSTADEEAVKTRTDLAIKAFAGC